MQLVMPILVRFLGDSDCLNRKGGAGRDGWGYPKVKNSTAMSGGSHLTAYSHTTSFTTAKSRVFMTATQNCTSDQSTCRHVAIYLEAI